jgi:4-amino-4-deoxy-L-arabinose transferase-like glycosyltransferase
VAFTFFIARKLFDATVAWLAAGLTFASDLLWRFSVSGLSTLLLLIIFLALINCLLKIEALARGENILPRKLFSLAVAIGALLGIGLLTRYAFGWLLIPVIVFLTLFGGARRLKLNLTIAGVFVLVATPWLIRNVVVSGTLFGTAGYAIAELPGTELMRSLNPNLDFGITAYVHKFLNTTCCDWVKAGWAFYFSPVYCSACATSPGAGCVILR